MKDILNKPDIESDTSHSHPSEFSAFESGYWRMLTEKEGRTSNDDNYAKHEVEGLFDNWNERFGSNVKPRWLR